MVDSLPVKGSSWSPSSEHVSDDSAAFLHHSRRFTTFVSQIVLLLFQFDWVIVVLSCLSTAARWLNLLPPSPPQRLSQIYFSMTGYSFTYDHRILTSALPVRSAVLKQDTGGLVVRWVTTGESPLLYVFDLPFTSSVLFAEAEASLL